MPTIGDSFARQLHIEHLKDLGFKKIRKNFSRDRGLYVEHFQIQGSAWNDASSPWVFYLNCGITFSGLPLPTHAYMGTHASCRASLFTRRANAQDEVTLATMTEVVDYVCQVIIDVSAYFDQRHNVLRECYLDKRYKYAFLDDPELDFKIGGFRQ